MLSAGVQGGMDQAATRLGLGVRRFGGVRPGRDRFGAAEAFATMALALDAGVALIDCPSEPDGAERVLGEVLPPSAAVKIVLHTGCVADGPAAMATRVRTSLETLGRPRAAAVLLRPASALHGPHGAALWDGLLALKDEGVVDAVGIAACVCDRPAELARRFRPDMMQLPLSLLDQRLLVDGTLDAVATLGVDLHLRTAFLHGVALYEPTVEALKAPTGPVSRLRQLLAEAGADPMQAALAFVLAQVQAPVQASKVIVEVGSAMELRAVLAAARAGAPALDLPLLDRAALRQDAGCGSLIGVCVAA